MRTVDALEIAGEVLPRRWVRWAALLLLVGMWVTHNYSPILWFISAKSAAVQEDVVQPMLKSFVANMQTPAATPQGKWTWSGARTPRPLVGAVRR